MHSMIKNVIEKTLHSTIVELFYRGIWFIKISRCYKRNSIRSCTVTDKFCNLFHTVIHAILFRFLLKKYSHHGIEAQCCSCSLFGHVISLGLKHLKINRPFVFRTVKCSNETDSMNDRLSSTRKLQQQKV